jgi:hypothetical protein
MKLGALARAAVSRHNQHMLIDAAGTQAIPLGHRASQMDEGDVAADTKTTAPFEKWGAALDGGFQVLPDLLLRYQRDLKLSANDLVVVLNLTMAWWERDRPPFPRTTTLARRMSMSERTVQRSLNRLRKLRLLNKTILRDSSGERRQAFDLSPLATRLEQIALTDPQTERRRKLRTGEAGLQTQPLAQAQ